MFTKICKNCFSRIDKDSGWVFAKGAILCGAECKAEWIEQNNNQKQEETEEERQITLCGYVHN